MSVKQALSAYYLLFYLIAFGKTFQQNISSYIHYNWLRKENDKTDLSI